MTLGDADGQIDYTRYTLAQLKQVSARIDRERFPLNYANLVKQTKLCEENLSPQVLEAHPQVWRYARLFMRVCARALDGGLTLLVMAIVAAFLRAVPFSTIWWQLPIWLGLLCLEVFLLARYGGTPGKLILDLQVVMTDGSSVTPRASFMRMSPHFVIFAITLLAYVQVILMGTKPNVFDSAVTLDALLPTWFGIANPLIAMWTAADCASILLNSKSRALHDLIAGTMVVERTLASGIEPNKVAKVLRENHEASST